MNDFERMLSDELKRVRDEHSRSDLTARDEVLRRGRRRRSLKLGTSAAAAVALVVLAATVVPAQLGQRGATPEIGGQPVVGATIQLGSSGQIVANDAGIWVPSYAVTNGPGEGSLSRIDPGTNEVVHGQTELSQFGVKDMAWGPDGIWAVAWTGDIGPGGTAQSELQLIDPNSLEVRDEPFFGATDDAALYAVDVAEDGTVWAADAARDQVLKITPGTERVDGTVRILEISAGRFPVDVAVAGDRVWISNSKSGTLTELDAATGAETAVVRADCPGDLTVGFGSLWVSDYCGSGVRRVDLQTHEVTDIPTGDGAHGLVAAGGYVWVANSEEDKVVRIDPASNEIDGEPIEVGTSPRWLAAGAGAVWVASERDNTISRIDYAPGPAPTPTPTSAGPTPTSTSAAEPIPTPTPAPESTQTAGPARRCTNELPWHPTYLPPGFSDELRPGSGLSQPDETAPAIGHYVGTEGVNYVEPFIDVWVVGELREVFSDVDVVEVLGADGQMFQRVDGIHAAFFHEGCSYRLVGVGVRPPEMRRFAEGLEPGPAP